MNKHLRIAQFHRPFFFLFFFIMVGHVFATAPFKKLIDNRIHIQEGLSQGRITCITEDERGYMWFGTTDGLNRYDGYTFKSYKSDRNNPTSIPGNAIDCITKDAQGNLWIGTDNGLAKLDIYTEQFLSFVETDSTLAFQGANQIISCTIDKNQNIWCSTQGAGLFCVEKDSLCRKYKPELSPHKTIPKIFVDKQNRLWIGMIIKNSICAINLNDHSSTSFLLHSQNFPYFEKAQGYSLYQDNTGRLWINIANIGQGKGALFYLDEKSNSIQDFAQHLSLEFQQHFNPYLAMTPSITGDADGNIYVISIAGLYFKISPDFSTNVYFEENYKTGEIKTSIYKSKNKLLWLGQNGHGIQLSKSQNKDFTILNKKTHPNFKLQSIRSIIEDDTDYWVGGYGALLKIDKNTKEVSPNYFELDNIYSTIPVLNQPNYLWIGTEGNGLYLYNKKTNRLDKNIRFDAPDLPDNYLNNIYCLKQLSDTLILLGTYGGLVSCNPQTGDYVYHPKTSNNEINRYVQAVSITQNPKQQILVSYSLGEVGIFDVKQNKISSFTLLEKHTLPLKASVKSIYSDNENNYWIATSKGLLFVDNQSGNSQLIDSKNGLPNNYIYGILPDTTGNLWLSTNNGLSCYNPVSKQFRNYNKSDGLQCNEFNTGAYYKAQDNTLFFGGINGLNYFDPSLVNNNNIAPKIEISSIKIGNREINLNRKIIKQNELEIGSKQNMFTIEFVGLSFLNSDENNYKYRITEIDTNWIDLGHRHYISFNNMRHGNYTLEILASNNHEVWLEKPYVLNIHIKPHFYETTLFILIMLFVLMVVTWGIFRLRTLSLKKQQKKLEKLVKLQTHSLKEINTSLEKSVEEHKATSQELRSSNNTKDTFLSIIAHDILNPLSSIIGLSEHLYTEKNTSDEEKLHISKLINLSAINLKDLLYNLIQWTKLEQKKLSAIPEDILIHNEIDNCLQLMNTALEQKNITVNSAIDIKHIANADQNMVSVIFRNILSNALKFTPQNGEISITSLQTKNKVCISIKDSGTGMDTETLNKILDSNKDLSTRGTNNEMGTGIGLNLVLRFVKLCEGEIDIISTPSNGTEVKITLPSPFKTN